MPTAKPTLASVISRATTRATRNLGVATVGIVQSFDESSGTCSVQPAIHKLVPSPQDEDVDTAEEFPVLQNVPVMFPRFRGLYVDPQAGALLPGDSVLLVCLDRDPANWRRTGAASEPMDARLHDWAHCVAIPGLVPNTDPFTPTLVLNKDAVALSSKVDNLIRALKSAVADAAVVAALNLNFPLISGAPVVDALSATTGSKVLKVQE